MGRSDAVISTHDASFYQAQRGNSYLGVTVKQAQGGNSYLGVTVKQAQRGNSNLGVTVKPVHLGQGSSVPEQRQW